jgi:hypothetical protein
VCAPEAEPVETGLRRLLYQKAHDGNGVDLGTVQQCDCVRVPVTAVVIRHLRRSLSAIMSITCTSYY